MMTAARDGRQEPSPSTGLLSELRALRADVQENTAATVRAQLLVGRLHIQENRISNLSWQLVEVRRTLATHEARKEKPLASLKRAEDGIAQGLQGFDLAIAEARAELARIAQDEQPIRAQEAQLGEELKRAQQRWAEFNSQLDALERALPTLLRNR